MRRDPVRLRWSIMAIAVALVALALPTMNAAATEARVVVAGSAPVPTNVTVVHQAITTTFDVTLSPRSTTGLANHIAGIAGLSSVVQPSPSTVLSHASARTAVATTCPADGGETTTTPNANGGYTPFQFAQLYGLASEWAT